MSQNIKGFHVPPCKKQGMQGIARKAGDVCSPRGAENKHGLSHEVE